MNTAQPLTWADNTALEVFRSCRRRYFYEWELAIKPNYDATEGDSDFPIEQGKPAHTFVEPIYFAFGHAIHAGLDAFFNNRQLSEALDAFDKIWLAWLELARHDEKDDPKRTRRKGRELLYQYVDKYEPFFTGAIVVEREYKFAVSLPDYFGGFTSYRGIIDHVGQLANGEIYAIDFKTASMNNTNNMLAMRIRNQFVGYWYALQQDPRFAANMKSRFIVDFLISTNNTTSVERIDAIVEDWLVKEWLEETTINLKSIDLHRSIEVWPKDTGACTSFNRLCPYFSLCGTPPKVRQAIMESDYVAVDRNKLSLVGGDL